MFDELEKLSKTLGFVAENEAKKVIEIVNEKLMNLTEAHIVDVLWKEEARHGDLLRPFLSIDKTKRGGLKPYVVNANPSEGEKIGIWTWTFCNNEPIWIENIKKKDLSQPVINNSTREKITPAYLEFFDETDSIVVVPLFFRSIVWGVLSVELPRSGKLTSEIIDFIKQVAESLATIIWKADTQNLNQQQTQDAISLFSDSIRNQEIVLNSCKTGFIVRPFESHFNDVEESISKFLEKKGIKAEHYHHIPGRGIVIQDIMDQIRNSHFGIIDVTGFKPNVLLELGMLMVLDKKFILLHETGNEITPPFDLLPYHFYEYRLLPESRITIKSPGSSEFEAFLEDILATFVENEVEFHGAKPFQP